MMSAFYASLAVVFFLGFLATFIPEPDPPTCVWCGKPMKEPKAPWEHIVIVDIPAKDPYAECLECDDRVPFIEDEDKEHK
jgi:hypothetical protein